MKALNFLKKGSPNGKCSFVRDPKSKHYHKYAKSKKESKIKPKPYIIKKLICNRIQILVKNQINKLEMINFVCSIQFELLREETFFRINKEAVP